MTFLSADAALLAVDAGLATIALAIVCYALVLGSLSGDLPANNFTI